MSIDVTSRRTSCDYGFRSLVGIRGLLTVRVDPEPPEPACPRPPTGERRYTNGPTLATNPGEEQAFDAFLEAEGSAPSSVAALRQWVLENHNHAP